jgi:methylated-DNA-[protein]-cysteine S-methyltransferase
MPHRLFEDGGGLRGLRAVGARRVPEGRADPHANICRKRRDLPAPRHFDATASGASAATAVRLRTSLGSRPGRCDEWRKIRADTPALRRDDGRMETQLVNLPGLTACEPQVLVVDHLPSPLGEMYVITDEAQRLRAFGWTDHEYRGLEQLKQRHGARIRIESGSAPASIRSAIEDYFAGNVHAVDKIECATDGTPFQQDVWNALRDIPAGTTLSYGALAAKIGKPSAVRAVGLANGSNPICIVLPCHRVIGTDGSLTGYGGGLDRKRWLLAHEGVKGLLGNAPRALL